MKKVKLPDQLDDTLRGILSQSHLLHKSKNRTYPLPVSYNAASMWTEWQVVGNKNVFVSPHHKINILWNYFTSEDGKNFKQTEFFGCFTKQGIYNVIAQNAKIIEDNKPKKEEPSTTLDAALNTGKRKIDTDTSQKVKTVRPEYVRFLEKMNNNFVNDLDRSWWDDYYININPVRIEAIKEEYAAFMTGADKTRDIFALVPITLTNVVDKAVQDAKFELANHENGILLVVRPDGKKWLVHIEPDQPSDEKRANMLRRSIITLSKMMFGFDSTDRLLTIHYPLPQVYTRDSNCIFWTRYITRQLVHFFKTSRQITANSTKDQAQTAMNEYVAGLSNWREKLPLLIESYKKKTVLPTVKRTFEIALVAQATDNNYPLIVNPGLSLEDRIKLSLASISTNVMTDENTFMAKSPEQRAAFIQAEYERTSGFFKELCDMMIALLQFRGGRKTRNHRRRFRKNRTYKQ